jgi:hypothetical protein
MLQHSRPLGYCEGKEFNPPYYLAGNGEWREAGQSSLHNPIQPTVWALPPYNSRVGDYPILLRHRLELERPYRSIGIPLLGQLSSSSP